MPEEPFNCPHCGSRAARDDVFCPECGANLKPSERKKAAKVKEPVKRKENWIKVGKTVSEEESGEEELSGEEKREIWEEESGGEEEESVEATRKEVDVPKVPQKKEKTRPHPGIVLMERNILVFRASWRLFWKVIKCEILRELRDSFLKILMAGWLDKKIEETNRDIDELISLLYQTTAKR